MRKFTVSVLRVGCITIAEEGNQVWKTLLQREVCVAIPQIQAEETHEKQGFCASRDNTESLHEEYTQLGNNKKSSLLEEVVEEAEREDLQRKLAAELSFRL